MEVYQPSQNLNAYNVLLRGDVSGIQDFIFNIQSKGAAKSLKARSFAVIVMAKAAIELVRQCLGHQHVLEFYEGGGNFYLFVNAQAQQLHQLRRQIDSSLASDEVYLCLSFLEMEDVNGDFVGAWKAMNEVLAPQDKLAPFKSMFSAFDVFDRHQHGNWKQLTERLVGASSFDWQPGAQKLTVETNGIAVFGKKLQFLGQGDKLKNSLLNEMPKWTSQIVKDYRPAIERVENAMKIREDYSDYKPKNGNIIPFEFLAAFAWQRSGSEKLGILKMDADNLSRTFSGLNSRAEIEALSKGLKIFFENKVYELLTTRKFASKINTPNGVETKEDIFRHNIYPVFVGGDDCFFIGAWDAVFEFSLLLNAEFSAFLKAKNLPQTITLSAGLLVVHDKFPVVRFAELAEDALQAAKSKIRKGETEPQKNKITVFEETLTWAEFKRARFFAQQLEKLIKDKKRSKAILNRLKNVSIGYDRMQRRLLEEGLLSISQFNRFTFYLGKLRGERRYNNPDPQLGKPHDDRQHKGPDPEVEKLVENIIHECQNALVNTMASGQAMSPLVFSVAARWAELLCRSSNNH